jgi:hypothetical protein
MLNLPTYISFKELKIIFKPDEIMHVIILNTKINKLIFFF